MNGAFGRIVPCEAELAEGGPAGVALWGAAALRGALLAGRGRESAGGLAFEPLFAQPASTNAIDSLREEAGMAEVESLL